MFTPILITSAIAPPANTPMLRMTDSTMRSITTKAAIFFWVGQGQKSIVICDATAASVLSPEELATIGKLGVAIEQLLTEARPRATIAVDPNVRPLLVHPSRYRDQLPRWATSPNPASGSAQRSRDELGPSAATAGG